MTKEINKRLAKIEGHRSFQDPRGEKAAMLQTIRERDPNLAGRLRLAIADAGGDLEFGLQKLSDDDVGAIVALFTSVLHEESDPDLGQQPVEAGSRS